MLWVEALVWATLNSANEAYMETGNRLIPAPNPRSDDDSGMRTAKRLEKIRAVSVVCFSDVIGLFDVIGCLLLSARPQRNPQRHLSSLPMLRTAMLGETIVYHFAIVQKLIK